MEQRVLQELVVTTGRILLEEGLAARTWGNVSCLAGRGPVPDHTERYGL